ncbi:tail protein X [Citromicrobium bathyomarinum]
MIVTAQDGETLDALVWRVLGRTAALTERAYDDNPDLADLGPQLPGGTQVDLTGAVKLAATPPRRAVVSLWD